MLEYFVRRYTELVKKKLGTDTLDTQLAYSIRFYCMGSVGMTREWVLYDNITSAETGGTDDVSIHAGKPSDDPVLNINILGEVKRRRLWNGWPFRANSSEVFSEVLLAKQLIRSSKLLEQ